MSRNRPSHRDRLEREYLALAAEAAGSARDYEARLAAMQREIKRIEDGGRPDRPVQQAAGGRRDGLDSVPESRLAVLPDIDEPAVGGDYGSSCDDYRAKALRMTSMLVGVCRLITHAEENQPKLVAHVVMIAADLPGACSMRQVAEAYGLSPERVSQRVEEVQLRFNLPKNQHNKSAAAVQSYRVNAALNRQPRTAA